MFKQEATMKKQAYTLVGMLILVSMMAISTAMAQSGNQPLVATIPFDFSLGGQALSAGKYTVTIANPASDQRVIRLMNLATRETAIVLTHPRNGKSEDGARLTFRRYGERYFLAQAWTGADSVGMEVSKSSAERAISKDLAETAPQTETVALKRK
jgi:hypothetical protein